MKDGGVVRYAVSVAGRALGVVEDSRLKIEDRGRFRFPKFEIAQFEIRNDSGSSAPLQFFP
jgi:hypothetical protein